MDRGIQRIIVIGMLVLAAFVLAACQPDQQIITPVVPGISVSITGDACPDVVVKVGDHVTWTNQDSREHIVAHLPAVGDSQFSSGTLKPQDSFAINFMEAGTYIYNCSTTGETLGTVTVES